jgi:hypothetical protein
MARTKFRFDDEVYILPDEQHPYGRFATVDYVYATQDAVLVNLEKPGGASTFESSRVIKMCRKRQRSS